MNLAKLMVAIGATTSGFQRSMAAAERRVDALERRSNGLRKGLGRAGGAMRSLAKIATGVLVGALLATALALGGAANAAIDYEDAFAGVRKTVDATEPELQQLSKDIRQMATEIPIAATELANLGETAGALGVKTKDLKEFIRVTAMLGLTTNVSSSEAADALGRLGNILGLTADDYSKFASALVALGNAGASTEAEILEITKRMGAAGKVAGLTTPQIIGWASALASVTGMEPERAGTSMQMFLLSLTKISSKLGPKLTTLSRVAGMSAKGFQKLFSKDANKALLEFIAGLDKLSRAKKLKVLEQLGFTDSGVTRALLGLASSHAEVARQLGISTEEYEKNIAAQTEMDKRLATTKSQIALLKGILFDLAITLGDALLPVITPLIKGLGAWILANKELITQIAMRLVEGIRTVAGAIGTWVAQNGPLIHQVGTALFGALKTVWTVLTTQVIPALFGTGGKGGIIPGVIELGHQIFEWLVPKVLAFIDTLTKPGGVIASITKVAKEVLPGLLAAFGTIVDALFGPNGLIPVLGDLIATLWGDGKGPLAMAVKGIAWLFTNVLAPVITKILEEITELIDDINTAINLLPKLKSDLQNNSPFADIGRWWESITPDRKASGGGLSVNRPTWVGEEGPELVFPSRSGMEVASNRESMAMGRGGGDTNINVTLPGATRPMTMADVNRKLRRLADLGYFEGNRSTAMGAGW